MKKLNQKVIIAQMARSEKGNLVWHVQVQGSKAKKKNGYCKTALAAIRFAYMLKAQTGAAISTNCIERLVYAHNLTKQQTAEQAAQVAVAQ